MKKYRVVTDSLDWYGVKRETILHEHIDNFYSFLPGSVAGHPVRNQYDIYSAIAAHPEWFSEIKEEPNWNDLLMGKSLKECEDIIRKVKGSPKEEAKEFTKKDMASFAGFLIVKYIFSRDDIKEKTWGDLFDDWNNWRNTQAK